jgi:hypothetical protein
MNYIIKSDYWWKNTPRYGGKIHPSDGGGKHPVMVEEITPPSPCWHVAQLSYKKLCLSMT